MKGGEKNSWNAQKRKESNIMCKVGDIIVVNKYIAENRKEIGRHSFVVIDDNPDSICGLDYTMVTTVISSFKSEKQRKKKLSYMENVEVVEFKKNGKIKKFAKPSYIKADKLFYFDKNKLDYYVFGRISDDLLAELIKIIVFLSKKDKLVVVNDNLQTS